MRFFLRHLFATAAVSAFSAVLAALAYFALLGWAMVSDQGLGGPFALPFICLFGVVFGCLVSVTVLFPLTAAAQLLRTRFLPSVVVFECPALLGMALLLVGTAATTVALTLRPSFPTLLLLTAIAFSVLVGLLFAYWFVLRAADALIAFALWLYSRLVARRSSPAPIRGAA